MIQADAETRFFLHHSARQGSAGKARSTCGDDKHTRATRNW
jgi:hypothetical protein